MANTQELAQSLKIIVKELFPELNGYSFPVKARVVKVHEAGGKIDAMRKVYSADVQPLNPDGSTDAGSPVVPDVEIPVVWAGAERGIYCLPEIGAIVRLAYYYNDPALPYIDAVLGEGYAAPAHPLGSIIIQHSSGIKIEIAKGGNITLITGASTQITAGSSINLKAARISLSSDDITFTDGGGHPLAFADVIKAVFDGHTHPGVHGETGPPTQSMTGHASGKAKTG
jgi:hypothetical protein